MGHFLTRLGVYTANPFAFLVLVVYGALWYVFKPETFEWHAVATLATWAMLPQELFGLVQCCILS